MDILLIEDNEDDVAFLQQELQDRSEAGIHVTQVERLSQADQKLHEQPFDVVLLDLKLPDSLPLETLQWVKIHASNVPILIMTGSDDELLAMRAMQEGAQDYLYKGEIRGHSLLRSIQYAIERKRIQAQLMANQDRATPHTDRIDEEAHRRQVERELAQSTSISTQTEPISVTEEYQGLVHAYDKAVQSGQPRPTERVQQFARELVEQRVDSSAVVSLHTQDASPPPDTEAWGRREAYSHNARLMLLETLAGMVDAYREKIVPRESN